MVQIPDKEARNTGSYGDGWKARGKIGTRLTTEEMDRSCEDVDG